MHKNKSKNIHGYNRCRNIKNEKLSTKSVKSFVHPCERRRKIQLKIYRSKEVKF